MGQKRTASYNLSMLVEFSKYITEDIAEGKTWPLSIVIAFEKDMHRICYCSCKLCVDYFVNRNRYIIEAGCNMYASVRGAIIGSDNGLSPVRRQAIIWTNAGLLLFRPMETNFREISIKWKSFHWRKCVRRCRLQNGNHFSRPQLVKYIAYNPYHVSSVVFRVFKGNEIPRIKSIIQKSNYIWYFMMTVATSL